MFKVYRVRILAKYTIRGKGVAVIHVALCAMGSVGVFVKYANRVNVVYFGTFRIHVCYSRL